MPLRWIDLAGPPPFATASSFPASWGFCSPSKMWSCERSRQWSCTLHVTKQRSQCGCKVRKVKNPKRTLWSRRSDGQSVQRLPVSPDGFRILPKISKDDVIKNIQMLVVSNIQTYPIKISPDVMCSSITGIKKGFTSHLKIWCRMPWPST